MTIETSYFGYGVGLVLVGFVCGVILATVRDALLSLKG